MNHHWISINVLTSTLSNKVKLSAMFKNWLQRTIHYTNMAMHTTYFVTEISSDWLSFYDRYFTFYC
jgi:hypothetical protein